MKITKSQLKQIIKEELASAMFDPMADDIGSIETALIKCGNIREKLKKNYECNNLVGLEVEELQEILLKIARQ